MKIKEFFESKEKIAIHTPTEEEATSIEKLKEIANGK